MKFVKANRIAPDGTPRFAASYLGLFWLPMSHKRTSGLYGIYTSVFTFFVVVLGLNVPPTVKVIRSGGLGFKSHPKDWRSPGSNRRHLVYKPSSFTATPRRLLSHFYNHDNCKSVKPTNIKQQKEI